MTPRSIKCPRCGQWALQTIDRHDGGYTVSLTCCGFSVEYDRNGKLCQRIPIDHGRGPDRMGGGGRTARPVWEGLAAFRFIVFGSARPDGWRVNGADYIWHREPPVPLELTVYHRNIQRNGPRRIEGVEMLGGFNWLDSDQNRLRQLALAEFLEQYPDGKKVLGWDFHHPGDFIERFLEG